MDPQALEYPGPNGAGNHPMSHDDLFTTATADGPNRSTRTRSIDGDPVSLHEIGLLDSDRLPQVPGYQVIDKIGQGGMGAVFRVRDQSTGTFLALKMIRADRVGPELLDRFHREIKALMDLHHPGIARIYAHGTIGDNPYFTQRLLQSTLSQRAPEFRRHPERTVRLVIQIAEALEYLHQQGMIHRDIKPSNIFLDHEDRAYLGDFGLVKSLRDDPESDDGAATAGMDTPVPIDSDTAIWNPHQPDGSPSTKTGAVIGTYAYMSPEQIRGRIDELGPPSDVWAVGVILYELLSGRKPFHARSTPDLIRVIETGIPESPTELNPEVDASLREIVLRCLAKSPADRYPSAAQLAADLRSWLVEYARPFDPFWRGVTALAGTFLCVVGLWAATRPGSPFRGASTDRNILEREAREQLRAGKTLRLIEDGHPSPLLQVVHGDAWSKLERDADGFLNVHTTHQCAIMALANPAAEEFEVEVESRVDRRASRSQVGTFVFMDRVEINGRRQPIFLSSLLREDRRSSTTQLPPNTSESIGEFINGKHTVITKPVLVERAGADRGELFFGWWLFGDPKTPMQRRVIHQSAIEATTPVRNGPWRRSIVRVSLTEGFSLKHVREIQETVDLTRRYNYSAKELTTSCSGLLGDKSEVPRLESPTLGIVIVGDGTASIRSLNIRDLGSNSSR